jgi:hypothetical protein
MLTFWGSVIAQAFLLAVGYMSTSLLAILVAVGPFLGRLVAGMRTGGLKGAKSALASATKYQVIVWGLLWFVCVATYVYRGHRDLLSDRDRWKAGVEQKANESPYAIDWGEQFASVTNTLQAFEFLQNPGEARPDSPCQVKITTVEKRSMIGLILSKLARGAGCRVMPPERPELDPDVLAQASAGATPNAVTVHARRDYARAQGFIVALSNTFTVRRSYDMPPHSAPNLVWLQVGAGPPWRRN